MHKIYLALFLISMPELIWALDNIFDTKEIVEPKLNFSLSPIYFARLASREVEIYNLIKNYNGSSTRRKEELVTKYLSDYEDSVVRNDGKWKTHEHPLLIFRMIWRFVFQISPLITQWKDREFGREVRLAAKIRETDHIVYPNDDQMVQCIVAILNMHHVFDFSATDIAFGKFGFTNTNVPLSLFQMMEFVSVASGWEYFVQAQDWLNAAKASDSKNAEDSEDLALMQEELVQTHDTSFTNKSNGGDLYIFSNPLSSGPSEPAKTRELRDWLEYSDYSGLQRERILKHLGLCSNSPLLKMKGRRVRSQRGLKCKNDFKKHPYFKISPLKTETLSKSPKIVMYHDFLRSEAIRGLESVSFPDLLKQASTAQSNPNGESLSSALSENKKLPTNLVSKLETTLGLNVNGNASEGLQISLTYLGGDGQSLVSHDAYKTSGPNSTDLFSDRMSTILMFISDVTVGGEIVFPDLDLVVKPRQGGMLYWENYRNDGKVDWRLFHGSCPTVLGTKLVASTFIRSKSNMLSRPCGLLPSEDWLTWTSPE